MGGVMTSYRFFIYSFIVIVTLLLPIGCSDDDNDDATPVGPDALAIHGALQTQDGTGIEGIRVILHERTTNAKLQTLTNAGGAYSIEVIEGAYDICFFHEEYVTYYYGPLIVGTTPVEFDQTMLSAGSMTTTRLTGALRLEDESPAAGYTVALSSFVADTSETAEAHATADEAGVFDMTIEGRIHCDLDIVSPDGDSLEFIDIMKMRQPCVVEFVLETGQVNVKRHHLSDAQPPSAKRHTQTAPVDTTRNTIPFTWHEYIQDCYVFCNDYEFEGDPYFGQLAPDGHNMRICNNGTDSSATSEFPIWVSRDGAWMAPYSFNLHYDGSNLPVVNKSATAIWIAYPYYYYYWTNAQAPVDDNILAGFTITSRSATNQTYTCSYGYSAGGTIYPNGSFPAVTDTSAVNDAWMKIWSIEMDYLNSL